MSHWVLGSVDLSHQVLWNSGTPSCLWSCVETGRHQCLARHEGRTGPPPEGQRAGEPLLGFHENCPGSVTVVPSSCKGRGGRGWCTLPRVVVRTSLEPTEVSHTRHRRHPVSVAVGNVPMALSGRLHAATSWFSSSSSRSRASALAPWPPGYCPSSIWPSSLVPRAVRCQGSLVERNI